VDVTVEPRKPDEQQQQQQPVTVVATNKPQALASHPLSALAGADPFAADELVEELLRPADDAPPLGRRGEALLLAQVVAAAFVVFPPFRLAGLFDLLATLALVAGIVFCVAGLVSLGRSFSPLAVPRKRHSLVTGGLYGEGRREVAGRGEGVASIGRAQDKQKPKAFVPQTISPLFHQNDQQITAHVRHPLYGGLLMAAVGLAGVTGSESRLACAALLWLVVERKAAFEEAALAARYGADWAAYAAKTPYKFVPWVV
jgi:protein-S-isoprenylcysteine O-methyltransferase Ste14